MVIQQNTTRTSLIFDLGYFENPGTYSVSLKVYDKFNNSNELTTAFIIEDNTSTPTSTIPSSNDDSFTLLFKTINKKNESLVRI